MDKHNHQKHSGHQCCGHEHIKPDSSDHNHDRESCPVCNHTHTLNPEETLQRIEDAVSKIPLNKARERMTRLILLTSGTAAEAAEHKDMTMLKIAEVYLALRLAEECGRHVSPEEGVRTFRELARLVGSGLTAKYGLEGLTGVSIEEHTLGPAELVFMTCYGIGHVLAEYYKLQAKGKELTEQDGKTKFKAAKAEAARLANH